LERIAASRSFGKAERCLRLLRYLTQSALDGRETELKEYTLAINVFERPDNFDPRVDPVVRLEARRLRLKLAEYYQLEGLDDPVAIELPKGAYVPFFRSRHVLTHSEPPPDPAPPSSAQPRLRPWTAVGVASLCLSLGAWYLLPKREKPVIRASISVLGFRDDAAAAESSWIAPAVSELMGIELGAGQQLRIVPSESVARMRRELSFDPQTTYTAPLLERMGADLGSDYGIAGSYGVRGDRVRLDVLLFDLRSGQQLAAVGDESAEDRLSELVQGCARRIRSQLGLRLSTPGTGGFPPMETAAMESYARGMERLRQSDALAARPLLERAAALAPANPLVHSGLAAAWSMMGLDNRALQEARRAFDSASSLGRVQQLEIEGRYREAAHDWPRAIVVYQALATLLPDDLEYGLLLAHAETLGGKAQDALAFVDTLRKLPAPVGDDPRIDLAEAQSAGAMADFAHTRRAAHAAAQKARQHGARLQYARARLLESGAMQNLGIAGYADVRAEARGICAELGDRSCVAAALRIEANYQAAAGAPAKARPLYAAVIAIADELGNRLEKFNALTGIGYSEVLQGDLKAAEADDRQALAVGSEIGPRARNQACLNLAQVLAEEGRTADSRAFSAEALDAARQSRDKESIGMAQAALAHAFALEGKFPEAFAGYNEAVGALREVQEPLQLSDALLGLGDAQLEQGDMPAARKSYREASDLDRKISFPRPEMDMALARLALATGQTGEAANRARAAMATYESAGREGDRLQAAALLARSLVASGDTAAASGVLAGMPSPEGKAFPIEAAVQFRIARCLVAAHAGHRAEADRAMDNIAAEVSRLGLPPLERETELARAAVLKTASGLAPR
jgi:tetratricopeptide (TPR) repeat protein